jgi:hypothetical protein
MMAESREASILLLVRLGSRENVLLHYKGIAIELRFPSSTLILAKVPFRGVATNKELLTAIAADKMAF